MRFLMEFLHGISPGFSRVVLISGFLSAAAHFLTVLSINFKQ